MAPEADHIDPATPAMANGDALELLERQAAGLLVSMAIIEHDERDRITEKLTGNIALTYFRSLEESVYLGKPTQELRSSREHLSAVSGLADTQLMVYFEERMTPAIKRHQTAVLAERAKAQEETAAKVGEEEGHAQGVGKKTRAPSITNAIGAVLLEHLPIYPRKPTPAGYFAPNDVQTFKKDPALRAWFDAIAITTACESTDDPRYASAVERQSAAKVQVAQLLGVDIDSQLIARMQTSLARAASERSGQQEL